MKILIITPEIHRLGGVANHYLGLSTHWTFDVDYIFYGKRNNNTPMWKTLLLYPYDFVHCLWKLLFGNIDVVVVNPSLRKAQLLRDAAFLLLARACGKPVVTFMHGFDSDYCEILGKNKNSWFQKCFNKSAFMYTLYSGFKKQLEDAGITCPVVLTSTKVANELLDGVTIKPRKEIKNILFVARVNKEKGVFRTLGAYEILKKTHPELRLTICGDGPALTDAKQYVSDKDLSDVCFKGNVSSNALRDAYLDGDLYILPTTHGEGMATSVLEAMAFGLPVVTRPNGGVIDFWTEDMGYLIESLDPEAYADAIEQIITTPGKVEKISKTNMEYAASHFLADKVTEKYEKDILKYVKK